MNDEGSASGDNESSDGDNTSTTKQQNRARKAKRQRRSLFASLEPRIRHVSQHTVKTKWVTLPEPMQDKVLELFRSVERPVIMRHRDEKKRIEAQTAVGTVIRKYVASRGRMQVQRGGNLLITLASGANSLGRRLPRMPFPPVTKDANFDYESALDEQVRTAA